MQLCPRENKAFLPVGKSAGESLDGFNSVYANLILIIGVEVRRMMRGTHLDKHARQPELETI